MSSFEGHKLLTPADVAEFLSVKLARVYELANRGELKARRVGRLMRFKPEDVNAFLDRNVVGGASS